VMYSATLSVSVVLVTQHAKRKPRIVL